jgi:hypothetical protein
VFPHPSNHKAVRADMNERFHSTLFAVVNSPFALLNTFAFVPWLEQYNPK